MEPPAEGDIWEGGGKRYRMEKVVGNGAFGIVWRAREEGSNGGAVAIKKVILDRRYHNRELEMMKGMDHECVIKLLNHFEKPGRKKDETYLHLVMEYCPETIRSVALQYHKQRTRFPVDHIRGYLYQCLKALEYIHTKRICHRDLKPDNLLTEPARLRLKLIDFGCAKVLTKGQPNVSYICSRYYRAPELLFGATEYTCAVDLWSVGTILAELLLGHLPFQGQDSTQQHLVEIMKLLGTPSERELRAMRATCTTADLPKLKTYPWERVFPQGTSSRAIDLAHKLLCYDPNLRLTATQALQHPFFEGVWYHVDGAAGGTSMRPDGTTHPAPSASKDAVSGAPRLKDAAKVLAPLFDNFVRQRAVKTQAELQRLEGAVQALLQTPDAANQGGQLRQEVQTSLKAEAAAEAAEAKELLRKVVSAVDDGAGAAPNNGGASGTDDGANAALRKQVAELEQAERAGALAREAAAREHAATRQLLADATAKLERIRSAPAAATPTAAAAAAATATGSPRVNADAGNQTEGGAAAAPPGAGSSPPGFGRRAPSGGLHATQRLLNDPTGLSSPLVARQSSICTTEDGGGPASAARRSVGPAVSGLGQSDNWGTVTPMGANREDSSGRGDSPNSGEGGSSRPRSARLNS